MDNFRQYIKEAHLKDEFKELNITEITEGVNIDQDYIKKYINTYKLLWHNKEDLYIQ